MSDEPIPLREALGDAIDDLVMAISSDGPPLDKEWARVEFLLSQIPLVFEAREPA